VAIPNNKDRALTTSGVSASGEFGISLKDSAHIMTILRDTLYSDKVLAVIREYSANAWDAHREAGKPDLPISVTAPHQHGANAGHPRLRPGLSHDDVFQVFTQYGASTKRNSDTAVGMLGIGSKSGLRLLRQFTIMSWHGGTKRIYAASLDESDKGTINFSTRKTAEKRPAITIQIAVRKQDIKEFEEKAKNLFQYFVPKPEVNAEIAPLPTVRLGLKNGAIYDTTQSEDALTGWTAVMGCVPYRINLEQLRDDKGEALKWSGYINNLSGSVFFNIGDVQISASREELEVLRGHEPEDRRQAHCAAR
jgi:hypothetical protein